MGVDGRTDRPTVGRTRQIESIIPHMIKMCVGDMKWTRNEVLRTERRTGTVDKTNNARGII